MKIALLLPFLLASTLLPGFGNNECSSLIVSSPQRLVIISGKAVLVNAPGGEMPATGETIIFQKAGCDSCFVAARVDQNGLYSILVGDGKYKVIVRNPSDPAKDWLAPDQERFIDTGSVNSPVSTFNFPVRIKIPD
jgi:hypothetical protein